MSSFEIDDEIDKLVDKLTDQFRTRLKKLVARSEKLVLRQYIASQKETARVTRGTRISKREGNAKRVSTPKTETRTMTKTKTRTRTKTRTTPKAKVKSEKKRVARAGPTRERDYSYQEYASSSDEEE